MRPWMEKIDEPGRVAIEWVPPVIVTNASPTPGGTVTWPPAEIETREPGTLITPPAPTRMDPLGLNVSPGPSAMRSATAARVPDVSVVVPVRRYTVPAPNRTF